MDAPWSTPDQNAAAKITDLIDELSQNYAIAIGTHPMHRAAHVSRPTACFHPGRLIEAGPTDKVYINRAHRLTEGCITGRFGRRSAQDVADKKQDRAGIGARVQSAGGRSSNCRW